MIDILIFEVVQETALVGAQERAAEETRRDPEMPRQAQERAQEGPGETQTAPGPGVLQLLIRRLINKPPFGAQPAQGPDLLQSLIRRLITKRPFGAQIAPGPGLLQWLIRRLITKRPFGAQIAPGPGRGRICCSG